MSKHITFINHNKPQSGINGSSLQGYVKTSRAYLEMLFGPPLTDPVDDYKTKYEWHIEIKHDGETQGFVAIYDYKSDHSDDVGEEIHWHVGAKGPYLSLEVVDFITTGKYHEVKLG